MTNVSSKKPRVTDIDKKIGARIRERRVLLGMSQQQVADLIGIAYQQFHKYERGINRISAGRLHYLALILDVPISYFFDFDHEEAPKAVPANRAIIEHARVFAGLDPRRQAVVSELARALSEV